MPLGFKITFCDLKSERHFAKRPALCAAQSGLSPRKELESANLGELLPTARKGESGEKCRQKTAC